MRHAIRLNHAYRVNAVRITGSERVNDRTNFPDLQSAILHVERYIVQPMTPIGLHWEHAETQNGAITAMAIRMTNHQSFLDQRLHKWLSGYIGAVIELIASAP